MGSTEDFKPLEIHIEELAEGLVLEPLKTADNSKLNDHKTLTLNLNSVAQQDAMFMELQRAAIDPNAIVSLNLSHCNLNDLPDAFAALKLKRLNLSHNKFENVPECLRNELRFLESLNLSHNELRSFETEPKCVIKLRTLRINNNKLTDIPQWILEVNCFNLEELYYSHNEINSLKRSRFRNVNSYRLKKLEIRNCAVRSADIKFLKDIRTLNVLDLSNEDAGKQNCFASSESFSKLFENPLWDDRLTILCLNNLHFSYIPEEIGKLVVLEELHISKNDLIWLPDCLSSMERLRILDVSDNQIVSLPKNLSYLKNLEVLKASYNSISSTPDFSSMNLRLLDLYNNYLDIACDINIGCSIMQMDLEQNFFDTRDLTDEGYVDKKNSLRLGMEENRENGPKKQHYHDESDTFDDATTDSEWDCNGDQGAREGSFRDEDEEESWSLKQENCDNGCTSSDNEWMGSERVYVRRKRINRVLETSSEWMFEDD